jgi:hypothetical protein
MQTNLHTFQVITPTRHVLSTFPTKRAALHYRDWVERHDRILVDIQEVSLTPDFFHLPPRER